MAVYLNLIRNHKYMFLKMNKLLWRQQSLQSQYLTPKRSHSKKPIHLICFNNWKKEVVTKIITSAMNLKRLCEENTHQKTLNILPNVKVIIFEDHNEPILRTAVSKAASLLGATDVHITDKIEWDRDYYGKIYSQMSDVIFASTRVSECIKRFARLCEVPLITIRCRKHSTLQSLATIMSLMEDYGSLENFNLAYVGAPHQVLNDYLILCAMFKINFKFKCCCKECGVSPLLLEDCKEMIAKIPDVSIKQVNEKTQALTHANAIIAGPTANKDKISEFQMSSNLIKTLTKCEWTFYHTFPRGEEVDDNLFWHENSRTFNAFKNMQYIAAASMAYVVRDYSF